MKTGWIISVRVAMQLCLVTVIQASVRDWQAAASSHSNLLHRYSFDGTTDEERMSDRKGRANLAARTFGSGTINQLQFGVEGFDDSSEAVQTHRGPGSDNTEGAYLRTDSITLGRTVSFEILFSPLESEIRGGQWNLGYILSTRTGNDRGYFLTQGGPLPSNGRTIRSSMGNSHSDPNTTTVLESFTPGHWYYVAGSYTAGAGNVTWTNYVADVTAGQNSLTVIGPFTNSGGTYPLGSSPLGVGGRWDAQESFSGLVDEVNFYNEALSPEVFQRHLSLLAGDRIALVVSEQQGDLVLSWKSKPGKRYNLRSSTDLSGDPAMWPVFADQGNLAATPETNTLTIQRPPDSERYFVIEEFQPPPVVYHFSDFEEDAEGWTSLVNDKTAETNWELGTPSATTGPLTGANGSFRAWSTNLGDYGPNSDISLRSPLIDLSVATEAELSFEIFRDADGFGDMASVRFLRGTDLISLGEEFPIDMSILDTDWTAIQIPVPSNLIGGPLVIEWNFISDGSPDAFSGLSLDDVLVSD